MATWKLDLTIAKVSADNPFDFKISNLKPGDSMTRSIKLVNDGTLAIKDVLMSIEKVDFTDYKPTEEGDAGYGETDTWGENNAIDYLNQFRVTVIQVGAEGGSGGFPKDIIGSDKDVRLGEFYLASGSVAGDGAKGTGATSGAISAAINKVWGSVDHGYIDQSSRRINGATVNPNEWTGLPVNPNDDDVLEISIEFIKEDATNDDGSYKQNKYQGDMATVQFQFEARQWGGQEVTGTDLGTGKKGAGPGYIQTNERANNGNPQ